MESATERLGRRAAVDGLRGVAVRLVICVHVEVLARRELDVDIFFAVSGFVC